MTLCKVAGGTRDRETCTPHEHNGSHDARPRLSWNLLGLGVLGLGFCLGFRVTWCLIKGSGRVSVGLRKGGYPRRGFRASVWCVET